MKKIYNIDINLTRKCTFNCDYCFAQPNSGENLTKKEFDNIVIFIDKFYASDFFKQNYDVINLGLWGGEPTLDSLHIIQFMNHYSNNPYVKLFIFSNGYNIPEPLKDRLINERQKTVYEHPKICIQISYDGRPIHDIYRRTIGGKLTSEKVRETFYWLDTEEIPFVIKSTVTPATFKYMYEAYRDIKDLAIHLNTPGFYKAMNYFPTIDYYTSEIGDVDKRCEELKSSLIKIAKEEWAVGINHQTNPIFFFKWFNPNRALCSAGADMIAIDTTGNVNICHACLYDKGDHLIGNIEEDNMILLIEDTHNKFAADIDFEPEECKKCNVLYCLRCNHAKFTNSKKEFYLNRWRDYTNQPHLCRFFEVNDKVRLAMEVLRRKKNGL
jgi:radical SAM protein with 4Fe4S-binding SPASM domain